MKVIIAGGRTFTDYDLLSSICDKAFKNLSDVEIVSGCAKGADKLGEIYAITKGYKLKRFPADWEKNGKKAGYMRNTDMSLYADALIAFWDGTSKGTKHMIDIAKNRKLKYKVILYK